MKRQTFGLRSASEEQARSHVLPHGLRPDRLRVVPTNSAFPGRSRQLVAGLSGRKTVPQPMPLLSENTRQNKRIAL